jgi:hypothetical protein
MYKDKLHLRALLSQDIEFNDKRYIVAQRTYHLLLKEDIWVVCKLKKLAYVNKNYITTQKYSLWFELKGLRGKKRMNNGV